MYDFTYSMMCCSDTTEIRDDRPGSTLSWRWHSRDHATGNICRSAPCDTGIWQWPSRIHALACFSGYNLLRIAIWLSTAILPPEQLHIRGYICGIAEWHHAPRRTSAPWCRECQRNLFAVAFCRPHHVIPASEIPARVCSSGGTRQLTHGTVFRRPWCRECSLTSARSDTYAGKTISPPCQIASAVPSHI